MKDQLSFTIDELEQLISKAKKNDRYGGTISIFVSSRLQKHVIWQLNKDELGGN